MTPPSYLRACLSVALLGAARPADANLVDEIASIVERDFYSAARLEEVGWNAALARARQEFAATEAPAERAAVLRTLVASLKTSHTAWYPRSDPAYWDLTSLFEKILPRVCPKELLPSLPIAREDIGVFWKQIENAWFVGGVFAGGPADKAGLKLGDRVLEAGGKPFAPVDAFAGRSGTVVSLRVQRSPRADPIELAVTPQTTRPHDELQKATAESWRIIEHGGRKIAYIHMWSWAAIEFQQVLLEAIARSNAAAVDGFILDIRDGWGGAHGNYLGIFWRDVPLLESVARDGKREPFDQQIRKPAVLLINRGTRSGKETVAYGAKKHRLARLVGERTAGAHTFGGPFCLSDGSLFLLARSDAFVDGERLEGRGVAPDVEVPFDIRYAAGADVQLKRALDLLAPKK